MKINQNNDISVYRGETCALDFKISQRTDYYVPFLISKNRAESFPMVCITIGSTVRESKNIVSKQLWLELDDVPKFVQTTVRDLGILSSASEAMISSLMENEIMYQFKRVAEVDAGNPQLHFAYKTDEDDVKIDTYDFTVTMALDETITLDMANTNYSYIIELMDTEPMTTHILSIFSTYPQLINKMPTAFINAELTIELISEYLSESISVINKAFPNHWGHRINDPLTSPVASVSNIQILQPPRKFTVLAVVK